MTVEALRKDMVAAMKAKDKVTKEAVSALIAAVKKAAIDEGCRDDIKGELVDKVILKELKSVKEQIDKRKQENIKSEEVTSTEPADCSEVRNIDLQDENSKKRPLRVVYLSPQGDVFNQKMAEEMAQEEDLVLLCGHYEGIDERVLEEIVTDYVSIGDYVLTGGELPAMVMIDTISRLVPGVLHNDVSAEFESFQDNLLEYPQYSRPEEWRGKKVPPILLSGHHANIEKWRREQSILRTMERRPDLLKESNLTDKEKKWIRQVKRERKEAEKMK